MGIILFDFIAKHASECAIKENHSHLNISFLDLFWQKLDMKRIPNIWTKHTRLVPNYFVFTLGRI